MYTMERGEKLHKIYAHQNDWLACDKQTRNVTRVAYISNKNAALQPHYLQMSKAWHCKLSCKSFNLYPELCSMFRLTDRVVRSLNTWPHFPYGPRHKPHDSYISPFTLYIRGPYPILALPHTLLSYYTEIDFGIKVFFV